MQCLCIFKMVIYIQNDGKMLTLHHVTADTRAYIRVDSHGTHLLAGAAIARECSTDFLYLLLLQVTYNRLIHKERQCDRFECSSCAALATSDNACACSNMVNPRNTKPFFVPCTAKERRRLTIFWLCTPTYASYHSTKFHENSLLDPFSVEVFVAFPFDGPE